MNRLYQMNQKEYQGLLQVASEQVPFGIYAIEDVYKRQVLSAAGWEVLPGLRYEPVIAD